MARFALAILFAVLVAASRPVPSGGVHDLLAVGVVTQEVIGGRTVGHSYLSPPTQDAVDAYNVLLRSPAREALVQGTGVHAFRPASATPIEGANPGQSDKDSPPRILWLRFYGTRSRTGGANVLFDGTKPLEGSDQAWKLAEAVSHVSPAVTAAAARVLLSSEDDDAVGDALYSLATSRPDVATAEAMRIALDATLPASRRVVAIGVHKSLGGAKNAPAEYARLAADADPLVAAAAK